MKKIIIIILIMIFPVFVNAQDSSGITFSFRKEYLICKDNDKFQEINLQYNNHNLYALNKMNVFYNNAYKQIDYSIDEGLGNILAYESIVKEYYSGDDLFNAMNLLMGLYLDEDVYVCTKNNFAKDESLQTKYQDVINLVDRLETGPFSSQSYIFTIGDNMQINSDILKYYDLVDSNNLDLTIKDNNLYINGNPGIYNITFVKKSNGNYQSITFGFLNQVMISAPDFIYQEYHYQITVKAKENKLIDSEEIITQNVTEDPSNPLNKSSEEILENPETSDKIIDNLILFAFFSVILLKIIKIKRKSNN